MTIPITVYIIQDHSAIIENNSDPPGRCSNNDNLVNNKQKIRKGRKIVVRETFKNS
jgi:hypothetical protein